MATPSGLFFGRRLLFEKVRNQTIYLFFKVMMTAKDGVILVVIFVVPLVLGESTAKPEGTVQDNVITSERNPKVRVRLPGSAKYVGGDRWVLYEIARRATIGGLDFYVDSSVRAKGEETQAGSDLEHIVKMIEAKGYQLPAGVMYMRFVHPLDEQKRQELMIIYAEDLTPSGYSAAALQKGGGFYDRWPLIDALVERGEKAFSVERW